MNLKAVVLKIWFPSNYKKFKKQNSCSYKVVLFPRKAELIRIHPCSGIIHVPAVTYFWVQEKESSHSLWGNDAQQGTVKTHPILPRSVPSHPILLWSVQCLGEGIHQELCKHQGLTSSFHKLPLVPTRPSKAGTIIRSQGGGWGFQEALEFILLVVSRETCESETICNWRIESVLQTHTLPAGRASGSCALSLTMLERHWTARTLPHLHAHLPCMRATAHLPTESPARLADTHHCVNNR